MTTISMITTIFTALTLFVISYFLTKLIRNYTLSKKILDVPNDRSAHKEPTPRGGGIPIVFLFTTISFVLAWCNLIPMTLAWGLSGGLMVALIGWLDDIRAMPSLLRIVIHSSAAVWAIYWLGGFSTLDLMYLQIHLGWVGHFLAAIAIIWCINLYNFMDGIDGFAGMEGVFLSGSTAIILWFIGMPQFAILCLFLASIIAGFLVWNWSPAKIFMGDVGSGYLGFVFAVLALSSANLKVIFIPFWIILFAVFWCDATFTLLNRAYHKEKWYAAHNNHAYQCLIKYGKSHKQVTQIVFFVNIFILVPTACFIIFYPQYTLYVTALLTLSNFLVWRTIIQVYNECITE